MERKGEKKNWMNETVDGEGGLHQKEESRKESTCRKEIEIKV